MNHDVPFEPDGVGGRPAWGRLLACLVLLATLAACGGRPAHHEHSHYNPSRYYKPPGPGGDPWGPYIHEASARFSFPELWIRRVMRQESGGQEDVISWAGAMGLMQVMPDTYDGLKGRHALGDDPFDPHNNILAGTAYLREMYDRFGAPGFLAAYNAGPNRLDSYLKNGRPLPDETVNYVASIAPLLGSGVAMSGPLAVYAGGTAYASRATARPTPAGCDPDAAFNPNGPCTPLRAEPFVVAAVASSPAFGQGPCDPDAAYDPARLCGPSPTRVVSAQPLPGPVPTASPIQMPTPPRRTQYATEARPAQERMAQQVAFVPGPPPGYLPQDRWAIQVGAFANLATAQGAAEHARSVLPDLLRTARIELPATTPFGSQVAFRARLFGLSPVAAADACARLSGRGVACLTVPPPKDSF